MVMKRETSTGASFSARRPLTRRYTGCERIALTTGWLAAQRPPPTLAVDEALNWEIRQALEAFDSALERVRRLKKA
jgi:hypothetical protein